MQIKGQRHAWPVWALSGCSPECGSATTEGGRAVHVVGTGHVFIPGTGPGQVSQGVGRMETRGLSDPGPAHPQAQKQSGRKDASMTSMVVLQLGLRDFSVQVWVRFLVGGALRPYKQLRTATLQKKDGSKKQDVGLGVSKPAPPPDFHAEPHFLNLGSNFDEEVYLGRLPHSPPPVPTPGATADQSGLSDGEDNLPERGGQDLRNNLSHQRQEASVNNQSVPQI